MAAADRTRDYTTIPAGGAVFLFVAARVWAMLGLRCTSPLMESEAGMPQDPFQTTRQNLEDLFFRKEDKKLIENLRRLRRMEETRETLARVSGIRNPAILKKLVDLKVRPETLVTLLLVPLVEIAWADGRVDAREKQAILSAVDQMPSVAGSLDHALLQEWLDQRPPPELLEAWLHYVQGLCQRLTPAEIDAMKEELVRHGRAIADASGGFLNLGAKTSPAEASLLKKMQSAFAACAR